MPWVVTETSVFQRQSVWEWSNGKKLKALGMEDNVRKPRRTRGTVTYRTRNYFALGVLVVGAIYGLIFQYVKFNLCD
jgi:hypothetical protein